MNIEVLDNVINAVADHVIKKAERKNRVSNGTVNALANLVVARAEITKEVTRRKTAELKNSNKSAVYESSKFI